MKDNHKLNKNGGKTYMLHKYQSILDVTSGIICHQVNCQNVMGAGIAKAIYEKYPKVKELYHKRCEMYPNQKERSAALYGHFQIIKVSDTLMVANIFSQDKFGNGPKRGVQFTNAEYLIDSIANIAKQFPEKKVYIPEGIGCGYGGGDWEEIETKLNNLRLSNIHIIPSREIKKERGENVSDIERE